MSENSGMDNESIRTFCMELLHADDEESVISILRTRAVWENSEVWRE